MQHNQLHSELIYTQLLTLPQWQEKRKEILFRDGNKCRSCGKKDHLNVHHRQYHIFKATGKFKDPWSYDKSHLITLCKGCHDLGHQKYKVPVFIVNK